MLLDDDFSKTDLNLNYSQKRNDFFWKIGGGAEFMTNNWYGLPQQFFDQADANAHVDYKVLDYLSVSVKVNNIANQDYQRFNNFTVQGIQFLAGATYQFDF